MYETLSISYILGIPVSFALMTRWFKKEHLSWGKKYDGESLGITIFVSLIWPVAIAASILVSITVGICYIPGLIVYKLFRYIFLLAMEEKTLDLSAITRRIRGRYWDIRGKLQDQKGA